MFVDAREIPSGTELAADVCIVGAGAAGITIARELASPTRRVVLLESGFVEHDSATQSLYDGDACGIPYFPLGDERTRTRQFGGSTNRWNGECRPLLAVDFETRAWMRDSGWPFDLEHLRAYYDRAQTACELGPYAYTGHDWPPPTSGRLLVDGAIATGVIQYSPPTRFGDAAHGELARARTATVVLGANVVDLVLTDSGRALTRVDVSTITGRRFTVRAGAFVLATGGIENARLLLSSDAVHRSGIGNGHELVGRYFMEHLYLDRAASVVVHPRFGARYDTDRRFDAQRVRFVLTLAEGTQRAEHLPGSTFVLGAKPVEAERSGRLRAGARRAAAAVRSALALPVKHIQEQVPNRESRVRLSGERDELGSRRAELDWRVSPVDKQAATRSHEILDGTLRAAGIGRVAGSRLDSGPDWPADLRGARHHMGTTRMHPDPTRGVVDADCRVHGIANLYVAGSSVFPTSGSANPTLTIVALALRLADHLASTRP